MATGIVVGLSRYRDGWNPINKRLDDTWPSTTSIQTSSSTMNPSSHHRSYSDAPDNAARLRLPSISNLIEAGGQSDPSYRPSFPDMRAHRLPQTGITQDRVRPVSPNAAGWSPNDDVQSPRRQERPQHYDSRSGPDSYYSIYDPHRVGVTLPSIPNLNAGHRPSHILHPPMPELTSSSKHTIANKVIGEDNVPGKGPCYIYSDGNAVPKIINGDEVNPKWGTTKAGKPRKRLGQACNTCREKKIKCDPSIYAKCTQCQKFGRECRFEAPSRMSNKSPKLRPSGSPTASNPAEEVGRTRRPSIALTDTSSHSESGTVSSRAPGIPEDNMSPVTNDSNFLSEAPGPSKKARLTKAEPELFSTHRISAPTHKADDHGFALDADPIMVDRKRVEGYLRAYFSYVNSSSLSVIPEHLFLEWAIHAENKSPVSKLVLYCMLAVGCTLSKNAERVTHEQIFASIAFDGIMRSFGHFSIQLVQARLVWVLYEFQNGQDERAWDLCGAAMRTACAMNLNTEDGIARQLRENNNVYGLNQERLGECIRRTFWAAYTLDNFGVACLSITTAISKADCTLRLPCSQQAYERGAIPQTPIFEGEVLPWSRTASDEGSNVGDLGYLVQIASLCCDVRTLASRAQRHAHHHHQRLYDNTRQSLESQLRIWNENYTAYMNRRFVDKSPSNVSYPFSFGGFHLIYHYACMQLHRHVPHEHYSRQQVAEHAQMAYHHAEKTLIIAEQMMSRKSSHDICDYYFGISNPLSGYAIHYAIDIVSAAGINTKVLENSSPVLGLIMESVRLVDGIAEIWSSARIQRKQISERVRLVMNSAQAGIAEGKIGFCIEGSMLSTLSREEDLVYGVDRLRYIKSFNWAEQIRSLSDLHTVSSKGPRGGCSMWKD